MPAVSKSFMMVTGSMRWPRYFLAAHAACRPFSPCSYASINRRERVANFRIEVSGTASSAFNVFFSSWSSREDSGFSRYIRFLQQLWYENSHISAEDTHIFIFFSISLYWMVEFLPLCWVFTPPFHQIVSPCQYRLLLSAHISWIGDIACSTNVSRCTMYSCGYFCIKNRNFDKINYWFTC